MPAAESPISRVEKMPNLPQPYQMRDWRQVTLDYLDFVLDFERRGEHLPLVGWRDGSHTMVTLPSYVGSHGGPESINIMGAIVSGELVGLNMRRYHGQDWVAMCENYFHAADGTFSNVLDGSTGGSFWYDLLPNVLFYQVCDLSSGDAESDKLLLRTAEKWYDACVVLGGRSDPLALPNFDHTGFNIHTMSPFDSGNRIEPDGAAGIAWLEYMAWRKFKDPRFLVAADWSIRALEKKPVKENPLYETLLPYGAIVAARMNAELGRNYDVAKLTNWCFDAGPAPRRDPIGAF